MAYDQQIPLELQLLRTSDDYAETTLARYTLSSWNTNYGMPFYCIIDPAEDIEMMDIQGALEETLHSILDSGGTPDDVRVIMGLELESELDPEVIEEGGYTAIDLGYCFEGELLSMEKLTAEDCAVKNALSPQQVRSAHMAMDLALIESEDRLPAAKLVTAHEFTDWQAQALCRAVYEGVRPPALQIIADPRFNHSQMRELAHMAGAIGASDHHSFSIFETCAREGFPADKLRSVRRLMDETQSRRIPLDRAWLNLDTAQLAEVVYALQLDVPVDMLKEYATGEYPAEAMAVCTLGMMCGLERGQMERLLNPALNSNQRPRVLTALRNDSLTDAQLDFLCDATLPAGTMEAAYYGLTLCHLGLDTVQRYAVPGFSPEQMRVIYDAAASDKVTQEGLDVIAHPQLTPEQMKSLQIDLEYGAKPMQAARSKSHMLEDNNKDGNAATDGSLKAAAKESRNASSQLGSTERSEKHSQREELG